MARSAVAMLTAAQEKDRHQLYSSTVAGMERALGPQPGDATVFAALRWGLAEMDRAFATTAAKVRGRVACRAGCDACCSVPVHVQAHEVLLAAEHILLHFSPAALANVIATAGANRQQVSGLLPDERGRIRQPCPLLSEGQCSIYADRPEACRAHHTSDAGPCRDDLTQPDVPIHRVYIPALRARLFAVMLGVDAAMEAAGFDDRAYDFSSALHEALTDSFCRVRWLRRQPAFPDRCLAPE